MTLPKAWVSPEVVEQVVRIGRAVEPDESCGVVTPDSKVIRLPNRSPNPRTSYEFDSADLLNTLDDWIGHTKLTDADVAALTRAHFIIWHTHPGGVVGPGPEDLHMKIKGFQYLVVTLPTGEATIF